MLLVGLTGGLASGKTTIASAFQKLGASIIDADTLARKVVEPGKPAWRDIVSEFGMTVLSPDGSIDRQTLAQLVFSHPRKLQKLNAIIHPRVAQEQARITQEIVSCNPDAVIIYDAALLIEARAHTRMHKIIVVRTDRKTQIARACKREGLTQADALRRIRRQLPWAKKRLYADYVLSGTLPRRELKKVVKILYDDFCHLAKTGRMTKSRAKRLSFSPIHPYF